MCDKGGYSPSFKRPAEIMRMRRKRARSEAGNRASSSPAQGASSPAGVRPFSPGPLLPAQSRSGGGGVKRRNPFANIENTYSSPKKRLIIYNDEEAPHRDKSSAETGGEVCPEGLLFSERLMEAETRDQQETSKKRLSFSDEDTLFEEEEEEKTTPLIKSPQASVPPPVEPPPLCGEYPADWSLKTRLLFTSPLPFSWAEQPKAQEEAMGLSQHCRVQYPVLPNAIQEPRSCSELRCSFQQSLVYWQHPSVSWLSLFPRIHAERSFTGKCAPWAQDQALQQSLMSDWSVSLSSLYSLLKTKLCPYFYVCSYQFTVLFRGAGVGGNSSITAVISPTTRGLREAMKADGIEFSLPLVEEKRRSREQQNTGSQGGEEDKEEKESSEQKPEPKEEEEGGDEDHSEDDDEDDGGFSWLKEMGVQDKIKKPDNISIQLRKERNSVSLDHKPESLVCVEGSHTFTLINFLISCKSLVAGAGSQAGLPPTLLAPNAFRGATAHSLKARSVNVKAQIRSTYQDVCSLEITGPILPSSLHAITRLLRPSQRGAFSATLYTHAPTAILNTHTAKDQCVQHVELSGCGLHPATVEQLQTPSPLGKTALKTLHLDQYNYTWKI